MKTAGKIRQALKKAILLERAVKDIIREIEDYDLERLLKKVDAECMDIQHNLVLAHRLSETHNQKKPKEKRPKGKKS